jgi:2-dehydropantoate 2-reductase
VRFVVYGAGAIGGVIGGRLFEHGHDVVLMARGRHLEALADKGLRLESPDTSTVLDLPVVASPEAIELGDDDVVLLTTKSQDTIDALRALAARRPSSLPIVCAQNGVENERVALRSFSDVYGMCVMCPATHLEPGVVQAHSAPVTGLLDIGRWPRGRDDVARAVSEALTASTFDSQVRDDIARWKWGKLLLNLSNAVEAVCGGEARSGELSARARDEARACLEAAGIEFVGAAEDAERRGQLLTVRPVGDRPRQGGSSWQSLARGAGSIETDYLNGEVVLLGRLVGVSTPANALLQRLAGAIVRSGAPPGSMSEADVLARLR